jgi:hypothetical protein
MHFHIIFRTCDIVHSLHQTPRPFGLTKREVIQVCFKSMLESLQAHSYSIHVLGDRLSDEMLAFFNSYDVTITNGTYGNDESIRESIRLAVARPESDWVYLCEDDYLHAPECFNSIAALIEKRQEILRTKPRSIIERLRLGGSLERKPLIIHPPDYPDRYLERQRQQSYLFLAPDRHWRQIANTTFTLMAEAKTFRKFEPTFMKSASGADDGLLSSKVYGKRRFRAKALCLSPIPGLTTHMHEGVMTPLVDWEAIHKRFKE